jgi:hypothetical protein
VGEGFGGGFGFFDGVMGLEGVGGEEVASLELGGEGFEMLVFC